jgi:hypothetical protein
VDAERSLSWNLQSVDAIIWDLMILGYPYRQMVTFLSMLLDMTVEQVASDVLVVLQSWQQQGLIETFEEPDGGESGHYGYL